MNQGNKNMKLNFKETILILLIGFSSSTYAYSISEAICNNHKSLMNIVLSWRENGIPIQTARDAFNHEDNYELLFWLRGIVNEVYKDPVEGKRFLDSGLFTKKCIELHRGY